MHSIFIDILFYIVAAELQIRGSTEDNSKIIFLISLCKTYIVTPH